jgi:hypothetical protein
MNWTELKRKIADHRLESPTWESDQRSLLKIFDKAEAFGIDPYYASMSPLSNLRSAIAECKRAVRWEDQAFLAEIILMCATQTNAELRLSLHIPEIENVNVQQNGDKFNILVNQEQYERITRSTRLQYRFKTVETVQPAYAYEEYQ